MHAMTTTQYFQVIFPDCNMEQDKGCSSLQNNLGDLKKEREFKIPSSDIFNLDFIFFNDECTDVRHLVSTRSIQRHAQSFDEIIIPCN